MFNDNLKNHCFQELRTYILIRFAFVDLIVDVARNGKLKLSWRLGVVKCWTPIFDLPHLPFLSSKFLPTAFDKFLRPFITQCFQKLESRLTQRNVWNFWKMSNSNCPRRQRLRVKSGTIYDDQSFSKKQSGNHGSLKLETNNDQTNRHNWQLQTPELSNQSLASSCCEAGESILACNRRDGRILLKFGSPWCLSCRI